MADQENENGTHSETTKRLMRAGIASALSAVITYGIRKAAPAIRQKLQDFSSDGSLGKAKDAVGEKVEAAASAVTERLPGGSGGSSGNGGSGGSGASGAGSSSSSGQSRSSASLSEKELESRLKERAQNRKSRQKASTS